jgi:hypothetical protein
MNVLVRIPTTRLAPRLAVRLPLPSPDRQRLSRHPKRFYWSRERLGSLREFAHCGGHSGSADELAIGPDVRSVVTEIAEKDATRAPRDNGCRNSGGAGVGCDGKGLGEKLLSAGTVHALDHVSPARVALLVTALAASVLRRSPGRTASNVARVAALTRWIFTIGCSESFVARLTGLR